MRVSSLLTGLMFMTQVALAAGPPSTPQPSIDMLEFLGAWQTPNGKEVNPFELDDADDLLSVDLRPRKPSTDSSKKELSQDGKERKPSTRRDRLPEEPTR